MEIEKINVTGENICLCFSSFKTDEANKRMFIVSIKKAQLRG